MEEFSAFSSDTGLVIRMFEDHLDKSSRRWTSAPCSGTSVARRISVVLRGLGILLSVAKAAGSVVPGSGRRGLATSLKEMSGTDVCLVSRMFQDFLTKRGSFCSDVGLVSQTDQDLLYRSGKLSVPSSRTPAS